jgi:(p)ppGpp synthase/HD superfamily hydrolase
MLYSYRIEQAIRAATILHKDQVRKGSAPLPYVSHLVATAFLVADYYPEEDAIIAALLHDTLEDTDYTPRELEDDFGGVVREIVETVSEPQTTEVRPYTWIERKEIYIKQLKAGSEVACIVAAADKIHNLRSIVEDYYEDHRRFIADFGGSLEKRVEVYQKISNVLNQKVQNPILSEFNHVFEEYKNFVYAVKKASEEQ